MHQRSWLLFTLPDAVPACIRMSPIVTTHGNAHSHVANNAMSQQSNRGQAAHLTCGMAARRRPNGLREYRRQSISAAPLRFAESLHALSSKHSEASLSMAQQVSTIQSKHVQLLATATGRRDGEVLGLRRELAAARAETRYVMAAK